MSDVVITPTKQMVSSAVLLLLQINNSTTTLEVKLLLRDLGVQATQDTISALVKELAEELPLTFINDNGYRKYSIPAPAAIAAPAPNPLVMVKVDSANDSPLLAGMSTLVSFSNLDTGSNSKVKVPTPKPITTPTAAEYITYTPKSGIHVVGVLLPDPANVSLCDAGTWVVSYTTSKGNSNYAIAVFNGDYSRDTIRLAYAKHFKLKFVDVRAYKTK